MGARTQSIALLQVETLHFTLHVGLFVDFMGFPLLHSSVYAAN